MDFSYLISISEGDKEFTNQFISTFETNTRNLLSFMKAALETEDFDTLKKNAHQLKPSLEMLGLNAYHLALRMNENPTSATLEDIQKIEEECELAVEQMNKQFT